MMCMIEISEAKLLDYIINAGVIGCLIGIILGFAALLCFVYLVEISFRRNFKNWFLESDDETKKEFEAYLDTGYQAMRNLSKSNTRLFKRMHNEMCRLKSFLSQKWMQN